MDGPSQHAKVESVDGCRADPHQHLIVSDRRPIDFSELENVWRAVAVLDDRFHFRGR